MKIVNRIVVLILSIVFFISLTACGNDKSSSIVNYTSFEPYSSSVEEAVLPSSGIIALGEATHGNKDFTELKLQVFQKLVEQSDIQAFVLEGDFGGCQKVNQYIQEGQGTAAEAAAEIGFAIYRTQEMVEILDWMREFNVGKEKSEQLRFYGYDMQRYDNNKEELFSILEQADPALKDEYESTLLEFTDDTMFDLDASTITPAITILETLNSELESKKTDIIAGVGAEQYDLACQYAACILENTRLRVENNYGTLRDQYMAEHVQWVKNHEATYYGTQGIFITGHNGHIGKTTATVGTEKSMGQILSEIYGDEYYAIGTEFGTSHFLAPDDNGERQEFRVENKGDNRLAVILSGASDEVFFVDMDQAAEDPSLSLYLKEKQPMSAIGEYFSKLYEKTETGYTQKLSPLETYNALIYIKTASPSTMLPF